ncbi:MAG: hypothetical protein L7F78_12805 [Syntrophales bacterium LBB04]|nr:hypothetical protein [Syntrophales bacterium LBB04]
MISRMISCINCGVAGDMEISGLPPGDHPDKTFKYLGHNPLSGHMHYQCPDCAIVMLVDPLLILGEGDSLRQWMGSMPGTGQGVNNVRKCLSKYLSSPPRRHKPSLFGPHMGRKYAGLSPQVK